jgi:hypothetical protein
MTLKTDSFWATTVVELPGSSQKVAGIMCTIERINDHAMILRRCIIAGLDQLSSLADLRCDYLIALILQSKEELMRLSTHARRLFVCKEVCAV